MFSLHQTFSQLALMAPKRGTKQAEESIVDVGEGPSEAPVDKNKRFRKEKRECAVRESIAGAC